MYLQYSGSFLGEEDWTPEISIFYIFRLFFDTLNHNETTNTFSGFCLG